MVRTGVHGGWRRISGLRRTSRIRIPIDAAICRFGTSSRLRGYGSLKISVACLDSSPTPLISVASNNGRAGSRAEDRSTSYQLIGIDRTGDVQMIVAILWSKKWIRVHPSPSQGCRWLAQPGRGPRFVYRTFLGFDVTSGDGLRVSVLRNQTVLDTERQPNGGSTRFTRTVEVQHGEFLYFVVSNGDNGDYACDSTGLAVTIAPR